MEILCFDQCSFCWPPKLLLQTKCIMERPLYFPGLRTELHISGAIIAAKLLEEETRSFLETTLSGVDASQGDSSSRP